MSSKKILVVVISLAVIVVVGGLGTLYWYRLVQTRDPFRDITLAGTTNISDEWTSIDAEKITFSGDDRFLALSIEPPYYVDFDKKGIISPGGSSFNPELMLIDSQGNELRLYYRGSIGRMRPYYTFQEEPNEERRFTTLRIRSSQPLTLKKITWTYYYAWEMP